MSTQATHTVRDIPEMQPQTPSNSAKPKTTQHSNKKSKVQFFYLKFPKKIQAII